MRSNQAGIFVRLTPQRDLASHEILDPCVGYAQSKTGPQVSRKRAWRLHAVDPSQASQKIRDQRRNCNRACACGCDRSAGQDRPIPRCACARARCLGRRGVAIRRRWQGARATHVRKRGGLACGDVCRCRRCIVAGACGRNSKSQIVLGPDHGRPVSAFSVRVPTAARGPNSSSRSMPSNGQCVPGCSTRATSPLRSSRPRSFFFAVTRRDEQGFAPCRILAAFLLTHRRLCP